MNSRSVHVLKCYCRGGGWSRKGLMQTTFQQRYRSAAVKGKAYAERDNYGLPRFFSCAKLLRKM